MAQTELLEQWKAQEKTVTLTNSEWVLLTNFILMTSSYRKGEKEVWEKLAEEKNEDGTPVFKSAAGNAKFWSDAEQMLEKIRQKIDG